jgi:ubiquinone biosynthesis protein
MKAPTTKYSDVKLIVEQELGQPLENVFSDFEETPLASASLGQVHKAKLR